MPAVEQYRTPGGREESERRGLGEPPDPAPEPEVQIELSNTEPTVEQRQAYERFWNLFLKRLVRERQLDKNG